MVFNTLHQPTEHGHPTKERQHGAITVTQEQFERIEAAWEICSYGNARKAVGAWGTTFRECVAEVIGREPADNFSLKVA